MAILFSSRSFYYTEHCANVPVTHGLSRSDVYGSVISDSNLVDTLTDDGFTLHYHCSQYLCASGLCIFLFLVESTPVIGPILSVLLASLVSSQRRPLQTSGYLGTLQGA
jgi:hypothetical protein